MTDMVSQIAKSGRRAGSSATRAPRFVGRERELAGLSDALAAPPAVVLVEGEAGIGKSRLVAEFLATATKLRPLVTGCPPFRQPYTLAPVVDAIRQAADQVSGLALTGLAGALRPLFPEWSADLPPAPEPLDDASAARHRLFRALAELLDCLGVRLLVVEDVQWADDATLEFLLLLAARRPQRQSLVLTCRPHDVPADSLLPRLSSRPSAEGTHLRLAIGPLSVPDTAALMSSMLDGDPVSADFAQFVHERTEGVPLAVEESVRLMADRADVTRRGAEWVRRNIKRIDVPPTVRDAVLERAGRLGEDAQAMLRAAAVVAEAADELTLAAVAGFSAERAGSGLALALDSGLLAEDGRQMISFRHALACLAVHEAIPAPERKLLHSRAGEALAELAPAPVTRLARHFREAGDVVSWRGYAEQAADLALSSGDTATAIALLYDLVTSGGLDAESLASVVSKIPLGSFTGDDRYRGVIAALGAVLDAGPVDVAVEARIRYLLGIVLAAMSSYAEARIQFEAAIPKLPAGSFEIAWAMSQLGYPRDGSTPRAVHAEWIRRAAAVPLSRPADQLRLDVNTMSALLMLGDEDGWQVAAKLPWEASADADQRQVTRGALNAGDAAVSWGRYAEADLMFRRGLELAYKHDLSRTATEILLTRAHLHWFTGQWAGLAEQADSLAASDELVPVARAEAILVRGLLHLADGDSAAAGHCLRRVLADADLYGTLDCGCAPAAALARLHLAEGRPEDAIAVTQAAIDVVTRKQTWLWAADLAPARADALAAAGRAAEAAELTAAFAAGIGELDAPAAQMGVLVCQAIAAEAAGDHERAAAAFGHAATRWQELPRPYDALLARERQAGCLLAAGARERALDLLADVLRGLSELGAAGDADRVARRMREHGMAAARVWRGGPRGYGDQLSPRELEVVKLVATGRTNREIAAAVHRSPDTVAAQVKSAMRKLGVSSRTALAVHAAKENIGPARQP